MSDTSKILFGISSFLSLISTLFLIIVYGSGRVDRTFAFHLVFMVCVNNFLWSLVVFPALVYDYLDETAYLNVYLCNIQAFVMCFATNSAFSYVISISSSLVNIIIKKYDMLPAMRNPIKYYAPTNILLPIALATLPVILQRYDHLPPFQNVQCYLVVYGLDDIKGLLLRVFTYYTPYFFAIIYQVYTITRIFLFIRKSSLSSQERTEIKTLILYPLILCLTQTWLLVSRSCEIFANISIEWLDHVNLFFFSLEGFLNVLVYGIISLDICKGFKSRATRKKCIDSNSRLGNNDILNINQLTQTINSDNPNRQFNHNHHNSTSYQQSLVEISSSFTINSNRTNTHIYAIDSPGSN